MATLIVKDANGTEQHLLVSGAGTSSDPYITITDDIYLETALGNVVGRVSGRKFGRNIALTTTERVVSVSSTTTIPYLPTAAQAVEVISTNVNDILAGTGLAKLYVAGLDANWNEISETVNMNGTGVQALANTYTRINRAYGTEFGTYGGANLGTITLRVGGAGTTFTTIEIGKSQTQQAHVSVPAGKTLLIEQVHFTVETTKNVTFSLYQMTNMNDVSAPYSGGKRLS